MDGFDRGSEKIEKQNNSVWSEDLMSAGRVGGRAQSGTDSYGRSDSSKDLLPQLTICGDRENSQVKPDPAPRNDLRPHTQRPPDSRPESAPPPTVEKPSPVSAGDHDGRRLPSNTQGFHDRSGERQSDSAGRAESGASNETHRLPSNAQGAADRVGERVRESLGRAESAGSNDGHRLPSNAQGAADRVGDQLRDNLGRAESASNETIRAGADLRDAARVVGGSLHSSGESTHRHFPTRFR